jgi:hypothetical protein
MSGTLTVDQVQTLIITVRAMLAIVIPIIGGVLILAIQQYGRIKEAVGKVDSINGTLDSHAGSILSLRSQIADNQEKLGELKGELHAANGAPAQGGT